MTEVSLWSPASVSAPIVRDGILLFALKGSTEFGTAVGKALGLPLAEHERQLARRRTW